MYGYMCMYTMYLYMYVVVYTKEEKQLLNAFHILRAYPCQVYGDQLFAASSDNAVRVYSTKTGKMEQMLRYHKRSVTCLEVSGDSVLLYCCKLKCITIKTLIKVTLVT